MLGTLELVPLGFLGALDGWWCSELNHCGAKLRARVGVSNYVVEIAPSNLTDTVDHPQGLPKCMGSVTTPKGCHLYGFGDRPQGSLSEITASCIVRGREEITVALVASWGASTPLQTEISIRKGVNFGKHRRLRVPRLSLTQAPLLMHFTL